MTEKTLIKANELQQKIDCLENFMFWCSGRRDGSRTYPVAIMKLKRKWYGGVESKEYDVSARLRDKISKCVEDELELLKQELTML